MANRVIPVFTQYFDGNGDPLSGGKLYFYENKSSTVEQDTFKDPELTLVNTNPVILDGEGRAGDIYGDGVYRVIITDSNDVQIDVKDDINSSTLVVNNPTDSVNNISITNTATGEDPIISSGGQDTNVGMRLTTQALGSIKMETNSTVRATVDENGLNLASGVPADAILDEDDLVSDSNTALATQQSIKTYVDNNAVPAASQAEQEAGTEASKYVAPATQQYHPSAAKAWINMDGTGTISIRGSYNVASIADNGVGRYRINFSTAMSNANYSVVTGQNRNGANVENSVEVIARTTTYVDLLCGYSAGAADFEMVTIAVFGDL